MSRGPVRSFGAACFPVTGDAYLTTCGDRNAWEPKSAHGNRRSHKKQLSSMRFRRLPRICRVWAVLGGWPRRLGQSGLRAVCPGPRPLERGNPAYNGDNAAPSPDRLYGRHDPVDCLHVRAAIHWRACWARAVPHSQWRCDRSNPAHVSPCGVPRLAQQDR